MGFGDTLKKIRRGRSLIRDRCEKDTNTGEVVCKRIRINPDKSEVDLAGFTMSVDGSCNPVMTSSFDSDTGDLAELERKFLPKIVGKCKNTPPDY
jgi:hypothetical protein